MDPEELRKAAAMAGMEFDPDWDEFFFDGLEYKDYDPALPAYIASLLVEQITVIAVDDKSAVDGYLDAFDTTDKYSFFATNEQRIRAAMAVLEKSE